jgi:hypothetical protein
MTPKLLIRLTVVQAAARTIAELGGLVLIYEGLDQLAPWLAKVVLGALFVAGGTFGGHARSRAAQADVYVGEGLG